MVEASESLTVDAIVDAALERSPYQLSLEARATEAQARTRLSRHPLASGTTLSLGYLSDGALSDAGLAEIEGGLAVALWRPGQRAAASEIAGGYRSARDRFAARLRWQVSGDVRGALSDLWRATLGLDHARSALRNVNELHAAVRNQFDAGEVARLDVLRIESTVLEQERAVIDARAELADVERAWVALTGLQVRPASIPEEALSVIDGISPEHPELRFLEAQRTIASARVEATAYAVQGQPTLSLGYRRERGSRAGDWIDSIGVGVSIPVGGHPSRTASVAEAARTVAEIEGTIAATRRSLMLALHEVEHRLEVNAETMTLTERRAAIDRERWQMAVTGFEAGEYDITETLRAFERFNRSEHERVLAMAERVRLISEFNQTAGESL